MTSLNTATNTQIKLLRKLSMRKYRYQEKLFIAEGVRCVEQILQNNPKSIVQIFVNRDISSDFNFIPIDKDRFYLEPSLFLELSDTDTPQGILAICKMPASVEADIIANSTTGTVIALDGIQDPGNLGTIIRTASWFNATAILGGTGTVDPFHPKTVRSTAGATGTIPFIAGDLYDQLLTFKQQNWDIYLLDSNSNSLPIHEISSSNKQVLVFGNEGNGISERIRSLDFQALEIPGENHYVESLNVAMACGISLYHFSK